MPVVNDLLQFITTTRISGIADVSMNVFYYDLIVLDGPTSLLDAGQAIADNWIAELAAEWSNVIHVAGSITDITINNLSNPLEFFQGTFTTPVGGSVAGEILPIFMAWGFKYNRASKLTRNGAKRISPLSESQLTSSAPDAGTVTALNAFATVLGNTLVVANGVGDNLTLEPVIVRRAPPLPPIRNPINGVSFQRVTTQNTRKPGRGI